MAGGVNGSEERISTLPRDSGRSWQTEKVQPDQGCGLPPARSAERAAKGNWMSGVPEPLQSDASPPEQGSQIIVGRDRSRHLVHQAKLQMVLQVLSDAAELVND